jgi:hypothetical protein
MIALMTSISPSFRIHLNLIRRRGERHKGSLARRKGSAGCPPGVASTGEKRATIDGDGKQLLKPRCNYRLPRRNVL